MRLKRSVVPLVVVLCLWGTTCLRAAAGGSYAVYSVFIYNFIKYLEWPKENEKITIVVWNNDAAAEELQKMATAKSTAAREIIVKNVTDESALLNAHMVFVPVNSSSAFVKIADKFKSKPIVVVTEEADLTEKGAGVSFKVVSEKVRFQINNEGLKSAGIKVATTLESLAIK